jgi:alkylation response protein AidB-like acyl-CoA dehydrogenase
LSRAGAESYADVEIEDRREDAVQTPDPGAALGDLPLPELVARFREWMTASADELAPLLAHRSDFDERVAAARTLRAVLVRSGFGRVGWPVRFGGLGGTVLSRAAIYEELFRAGWPGPAVFEHLEIIAPTLVRYAAPEFAGSVLPGFLEGSQTWAQGFSEPEAGSDLASLRTRAEVTEDGFVVTGTKIWTSWAAYARWCLVLVRTGTREERHRGLTMLAVDLRAPGVQVRPIRQANGTEELAEVVFQDVPVPGGRVVGEVGGGWQVALFLLARERGTLSWLKQGAFGQRLRRVAPRMRPEHDRQLGDVVLQLAGLRATAGALLARDAAGQELGPEAAFAKLLMSRTEQHLFDLLRDVDGIATALPGTSEEDLLVQQEYLFSRIVSVYGGSQQMQLTTVARRLLGLRDA